MENEIISCSLKDLETIICIGIETYIQTFGKDNTKEVMQEYIEEAFSKEKIEKELQNKNSEFYFIK